MQVEAPPRKTRLTARKRIAGSVHPDVPVVPTQASRWGKRAVQGAQVAGGTGLGIYGSKCFVEWVVG